MVRSTAINNTEHDVSGDLPINAKPEIQFGTAGLSLNPVNLPVFGSEVHAATARKAGRVNANAITESELEALLAERQALLDKVFDEAATRSDHNRLAYVRWSLDRIEDARHGEHLDRLEEIVVRYERFRKDLEVLRQRLEFKGK